MEERENSGEPRILIPDVLYDIIDTFNIVIYV